MITIKSDAEIAIMREAGKITALAREVAGQHIKEGVTTRFVDSKVKACILSHGAKPSFLGYCGFPASTCISVNDEVIHGFPSDRVLRNGDIVKVDVGAYYKGYHGDCAATFAVGEISDKAKKLIEVTEQCFYKGIAAIRPGGRVGDISNAIYRHASDNGFDVVRDFIGHGVGRDLHEGPDVPNYGPAGRGPRLQTGMTLAIEPMINVGTWQVRVLENKWTVVTGDGKLSAHYENTVAITENGVLILTDPT
ncbi:MAG: type I methionyl aminopeptidase [Eubacteriales bacterium]|nr:type I methionyl aminopeptidase [Eubacteriales bacterium]MDD4421955.1 type I methionyl aminopeptidase [Eubacteriales bacterium]